MLAELHSALQGAKDTADLIAAKLGTAQFSDDLLAAMELQAKLLEAQAILMRLEETQVQGGNPEVHQAA